MPAPTPPEHLSAEARAHLLDPPTFEPLPNLSEHEQLQAFREMLDVEWQAGTEQFTDPWVLREIELAGVPAVIFGSDEAHLDHDEVIFHIHGGSYLFGSPKANAVAILPVMARTGLPVVSVDYRLAPEHPCPAGLNDCVAAYQALSEQRQIRAAYGESAGGGLALATLIELRDAGVEMPGRVALLSPWVDVSCSGDTYKTLIGTDPDFLDPDEPPRIGHVYSDGNPTDPKASPLFAELHELPEMLIQVGGREILLSDSIRLHEKLQRSGGTSTLDVWDGLWHVWHIWHHVPEAMAAFDELSAFLMGGS